MCKKRISHKYNDLKIGQKLFVSSVGVILIMTLLMGVCGYGISRKIILSRTKEQSAKLMEQLSLNYNYAVRNLENLITSHTYNVSFSALLRKDVNNLTEKSKYDRKKQIEAVGYNLINFNKYITKVIVCDNNGTIYYSHGRGEKLNSEQQKLYLDYDTAYEKWGVTFWKPGNEQEVFATKLLFDYVNMSPVGAVSVGVSRIYFEELYDGITEDGTGIVVLNRNCEILLSTDENNSELARVILENYPEETDQEQKVYFHHKKYLYTLQKTADKRIQVMNLMPESSITSEIFHKLMIPFFGLSLFAIILSTIFAYGISGQIASNIRLLLENIRRISKGDFSGRICPESRDEIGLLAEEFNDMAVQIQNLLQTVTNEKIQKKNSEIKALQFEYDSLQAKINPHFLYNTLESISSLAKLNGQQKIADSICMLGNYLREAISDKRKFVTLEEELENSRQYVEIQKLSYGDKLQVDFEVEEALNEVMVPKLILQPLVENSILHGIEPKIGEGHICIVAGCDKTDMIIKIVDDGVGVTGERITEVMKGKKTDSKHTKVGIRAVHKRIQILYGLSYGIQIESRKQEGTAVNIRLPIIFEDEVQEDEI